MKAALLLIDFINPMNFGGGADFARRAVAAAQSSAFLKREARSKGVPVVYANDNFGQWTSEFSSLVASIRAHNPRSRPLIDAIAPTAGDYSILKPRHSAFFGTPLEFLLEELHVTELILAGLATDICVSFTAYDAYLRKFALWIPSDCSAAESPQSHRHALALLRRATKARTEPVRHVRSAARGE